MNLSIVIPTLNELKIDKTIQHVRKRLPGAEIIVVDSSSDNKTIKLAKPLADIVLKTDKQSRGAQLNKGTKASTKDIIMFLHADHRLPKTAQEEIKKVFCNQNIAYAAFYKRFDTNNKILHMLSFLNNIRSHITGYTQGDNGIIARKAVLKKIEGIPEVPLMEDVLLSKKLKNYTKTNNKKFKLISKPIFASPRYFEKNGIIKSIFLMQLIKLRFFFGTSAKKLKKIYY
jgi:rSAM/selenodomain-associated transferase 2